MPYRPGRCRSASVPRWPAGVPVRPALALAAAQPGEYLQDHEQRARRQDHPVRRPHAAWTAPVGRVQHWALTCQDAPTSNNMPSLYRAVVSRLPDRNIRSRRPPLLRRTSEHSEYSSRSSHRGRRSPHATKVVHPAHNPGPGVRVHARRRQCLRGRASAAPQSPAFRSFTPGGLMVRPAGQVAGSPKAHLDQDESTNWSGYAVTGASGAFHSISASWIEPTGPCTSRRSPSTPASGSAWTGSTATRSSRPAPTWTATAGRRCTTAGTRCTRPSRSTTPTRSGRVTTSAPR